MRATAGMLLLFFLAATIPGIGWVPSALATVQQDLERAQDLFDFAEYQQAMELATSLITAGQLSETEERDAYIIRARSAVGLGLISQAREDFCGVHKLDQTWQPDPVMIPREEIDLFNAALLNCVEEKVEPEEEDDEGKPFYMKPVVWAATAGAVVLAILLSGGDEEEVIPEDPALADFPDPPTD